MKIIPQQEQIMDHLYSAEEQVLTHLTLDYTKQTRESTCLQFFISQMQRNYPFTTVLHVENEMTKLKNTSLVDLLSYKLQVAFNPAGKQF